MKYLLLIVFLITIDVHAQSSMRRCTLLPITDSVGGAIGFKVFEEIENNLKSSNWCTYVSNSGLIGVFGKYRESLPQYLRQKEVLKVVSEKLQVGSLLLVSIINEIKGIELQFDVYGDNGEDLYFTEKISLNTNDITTISETVINWLDIYSKSIPYDAKINGIIGDQITLDVGKGYPIRVGQGFVIKRPTNKKKHPLLKKIVDWDTEVLAEGKIFNISDNQAYGMLKLYRSEKKIVPGDWVRLGPLPDGFKKEDRGEKEEPGKLGVLTGFLTGSSSSVDTITPTGSKKLRGNLFGFDFRVEGWITRQYFAAIELARSLGKFTRDAGSQNSVKSSANAGYGQFKLTGGYKYLPIGFFYGPQIDLYGGYANYSFDLDYSAQDGLGQSSISGLVFGVSANVPINREYRFLVQADFIPFPTFKDEDNIYGAPKSVSALELEVGLKYQITTRMTLDASLETLAAKAKFENGFREIAFHDNIKLKLGASFNY